MKLSGILKLNLLFFPHRPKIQPWSDPIRLRTFSSDQEGEACGYGWVGMPALHAVGIGGDACAACCGCGWVGMPALRAVGMGGWGCLPCVLWWLTVAEDDFKCSLSSHTPSYQFSSVMHSVISLELRDFCD